MKSIIMIGSGIVLSFCCLIHAATTNTITQFGITWTFDKAYEVGQFVTGDWWVVGPAIVVSVSPAPTSTRNGTCVNPMGGRQGYDNRFDFSTADRISFPYTLKPDQSMVSSISKPDGPTYQNIGCIQAQAVLTAVSAAPASGTFRPSYSGTYKKYFNVSQIHWGILPSLPRPSSAPSQADLIKALRGPRIDHLCNWTLQYGCSGDQWYDVSGMNEPCYGRAVAYLSSSAGLYVMLNVTDKNPVVQGMIQLGIDNYGVLKAGGGWWGNGGHASGRGWPVVFAAKMLNDPDMLNVGVDYGADGHFGENDQTYYGVNNKPLWGWNCGGGQNYFQNGCSGSGFRDCRDPAGLVDGCSDYRSCCTVPFWIGEMLSALMLNAKSVWNHNAFFDFVDRWMGGGTSDRPNPQNQFVKDMWNLYRNNLPKTAICITSMNHLNRISSGYTMKIASGEKVRINCGSGTAILRLYDLAGKLAKEMKVHDGEIIQFNDDGNGSMNRIFLIDVQPVH
jgi:hypothetical protein